MKKHVRFRKGLASYPQGSSHYLPVELADMYIKAGIAEEVDCKPAVDPVVVPDVKPEEPPLVDVKEEPTADETEVEVSETETDADTATTTRSKRRKS